MLERLLHQLASQDTAGQFEYSVVIVDNDAAGSARDMVVRFALERHLEATYAIGTENTIPLARNHAIRLARGNYIGIIDDDEFPSPQWLSTLYRSIRTFDVDGALGPVRPFFESEPPGWLIKGRFCERPTYRTGTLLRWDQTRTGNVLLRRSVFDSYGLSFDEAFKTGGSDREFFKQAMLRGCRFVAVEEAPVYEVVPPERQTKRYWLRRALVNGYNAHRIDPPRGLARIAAPVKFAALAIGYGVAVPACVCLGTSALVHCLERGGHHLSRLCAIFGIQLVRMRDF